MAGRLGLKGRLGSHENLGISRGHKRSCSSVTSLDTRLLDGLNDTLDEKVLSTPARFVRAYDLLRPNTLVFLSTSFKPSC